MPTAVASFDDFDADEPAPKRAPRKPRAKSGRGPAGKRGRRKLPRFAFDGRRVARWSAVGMSGTLVVAILVNALVMQKGHHPAPLFGKSIALGSSPVPAPRPQPVERAAAPVATPEPAEMPPPRHAAEADPAPATDDPIAALIGGHALPPAAKGDGKVDGKTVLGAQKALVKLGFVLKASGTMGPQTRKAIEAFERDRHMPVKGELTHRVVKILAAESGIRID